MIDETYNFRKVWIDNGIWKMREALYSDFIFMMEKGSRDSENAIFVECELWVFCG